MTKKLITILLVAVALAGAAYACTSCAWTTEDGLHLLGRTYDMFGTLEGNRITVVKKGYSLQLSPSGSGEDVIMEKSFIGNALLGSTSPIYTDAINEDGLMGCLLNFPDYGYFDTQKGEENTDVHPAFFVPYILGTCSTVDDVEEACRHVNLTSELIFGEKMSVHYIFSDRSGETIVVEPDEDGITVHRDTIGVMANAPGYDWQETNLKGYVSISNIHPEPRDISGKQFSAFGHGTGGSFGLPGGYASPSRFVRMAFMKTFAPKGTDEIDGVRRMFHNFSVVYVPDGLLKQSADSDDCEQTLCTTVMCSESLTYYFSPVTDRRISSYNLPAAVEALGDNLIGYYQIPENEDIAVVI